MDKNEFLLLSEVLYQLHACQTMASLERNFFHCLSLFIPFRYASYIEICPPGGAEAAQPGPDPRPDPAGGGDPALFLPGDGQRRDLPRLEDLKKHFI